MWAVWLLTGFNVIYDNQTKTRLERLEHCLDTTGHCQDEATPLPTSDKRLRRLTQSECCCIKGTSKERRIQW